MVRAVALVIWPYPAAWLRRYVLFPKNSPKITSMPVVASGEIFALKGDGSMPSVLSIGMPLSLASGLARCLSKRKLAVESNALLALVDIRRKRRVGAVLPAVLICAKPGVISPSSHPRKVPSSGDPPLSVP